MKILPDVIKIVRSNAFGLAILACAAVSFSFPAAFTDWGGVKPSCPVR